MCVENLENPSWLFAHSHKIKAVEWLIKEDFQAQIQWTFFTFIRARVSRSSEF